jgi:hypothetical protein
LTFRWLGFGVEGLPRCIAKTAFDWDHPRKPGVQQVRYADKGRIELRLDTYDIVLNRWANTTYGDNTACVVEDANCIVVAKTPTHFSTLLDGPISTLRMIFDFLRVRHMRLTSLFGQINRRPRSLSQEFLFPQQPAAESSLTRSIEDAQMLTVEELGVKKFEQLLSQWHSARSKLSPILELFHSLTARKDIASELRFLTLVYILEAFHRLTEPTQASSPSIRNVIKELSERAPADLQFRVRGLLGQLGAPSLHARLSQLLTDLPNAFLNPWGPDDGFSAQIGPGPDFVSEVVNTRNFLTHLAGADDSKALKGFDLFRATFRLEWWFRYLLLRHLGCSRVEANAYILASSPRASRNQFSSLLNG